MPAWREGEGGGWSEGEAREGEVRRRGGEMAKARSYQPASQLGSCASKEVSEPPSY